LGKDNDINRLGTCWVAGIGAKEKLSTWEGFN